MHTITNDLTTRDFILRHNPCDPARAFLNNYTYFKEAWEACERPDWMLWALNRLGIKYDKGKLAAKFVREVWHLLKDERSKRAIEAIEQGRLTDDIKRAAYAAYAAYAAAYAADAYADAYAAAYADAYAAAYASKDMKRRQCAIIRAFIAEAQS